jgi:hypothetical protein
MGKTLPLTNLLRRQSLYAVLTVVMSTVACLLLVEWALTWHRDRIQSSEYMAPGLIRYHAIRGWQLSPNWAGEHRHYDYSVRYTVNAQGFREPSTPFYKGQIIALVGDSFTFGLGVNDAETFSAQLNKRDRTNTYLNFGIPGYSTDQELLFLESEILDIQPDIVVLFFYLGNDLLDNVLDYPLQAEQAKPFFSLNNETLTLQNTPVPRAPKSAKLRTTTLQAIIFGDELVAKEPWWAGLARSSQILRLLLGDHARVNSEVVEDLLTTRLVQQRRLASALITRVREQVTASGARLIIAPLPGRSFIRAPGSYSALFQDHVRNFVASLAESNGLEVIDVADEMLAQNVDDVMLFHPNEGHLTVEGHAAVARIVLASMTE